MSTLTAPTVPVETREHYLNVNYGIRSWLLTVDHKRIALLYLLPSPFSSRAFCGPHPMELLTHRGDMVQSET
jgi:cytochrome c oxidase subunit 1